MRFKKTTAASAVALGLMSFGGAAMAAGSGTSAPKAANEQSQPVDTDNVQEGDQTSTDNGAGEASSSEPAGESDGPGGHEDPPGNVDHQFDGEE